jgi:membrane fusion protein, multidrug efflux system
MTEENDKKTAIKTSSLVKFIVWLVIVAIAVIALVWYWHYASLYPSTDDSYVGANIVHTSPRVSGQVEKVFAENYQVVKRGEPLLQIDPRPFEIAVQSAMAQLSLAVQQEQSDEATVAEAKAAVQQREAELLLAKENDQRIMPLVKMGHESKQEGDEIVSKLHVATSALNAANKDLQKAQAALGKTGAENANVQSAQAALNKAKLDLSYTLIRSPVNGTLVNYTVREGDYVTVAEKLFSIVDNNQWWVNANFKETDLERIHSGQSATVTLDMYPDHPFTGRVYKISPGSGSAFSILPPENATGNWVKVTQRFPVKIMIPNTSDKYPLRVGASALARVNTVDKVRD